MFVWKRRITPITSSILKVSNLTKETTFNISSGDEIVILSLLTMVQQNCVGDTTVPIKTVK